MVTYTLKVLQYLLQYLQRVSSHFWKWCSKGLRGKSHMDSCTQCVITTQIRWAPTPCHIRHSHNFDKIGNLIVGWGEGITKEGLVFYRFRAGIKSSGSRIRQSQQTCHSVFIKNTEKLREVFKAKAKGLWSTRKACSMQLGVWEALWASQQDRWLGTRGQSSWKILRFGSVRDPLICLFFDRCERKK